MMPRRFILFSSELVGVDSMTREKLNPENAYVWESVPNQANDPCPTYARGGEQSVGITPLITVPSPGVESTVSCPPCNMVREVMI